jgi:hypothetical protein
MRGIAIGLCLALALLAGCQTTRLSEEERERRRQEELAHKKEYLKGIQSAEESVYESLRGLGESVADFNPDEAVGFSGAIFATKRFYPEDLEEAVEAGYLGDYVSIRYVIEGSPADRAGLLVGDRLLFLNGVKAPKGERATHFVVGKMRTIWRVDEPNELLIERNGAEIGVAVEAEKSAFYSVVVTPFLVEGVVAEGRALYFSSKTLEGLDEEELDYLCAFALVQNVMKHARMKGQNEFLGGMLDMAAAVYGVNTAGIFGSLGRNAHKAGFLIESDLLALYALASAGIDISGYPEFWEETFSKSPKGIDRIAQQRLDAMRQVIREIEDKRAKGEPIFPTEYLAGEWKLEEA